MPTFDEQGHDSTDKGRLAEIPGMVPALHALPRGCRFQDRCPAVQERCRAEEPELTTIGESRVRCHFPVLAAERAA